MPSGDKYLRVIRGAGDISRGEAIEVDVYSVLTAFGVVRPPVQHALKKLLCAGLRGKGDEVQDLTEARDAIDRAIEDAKHDAGNQS